MNVNTYNQKGEELGETRLPKEIFDVKLNPDLLHQVVVAQSANRRQGTAHTKDRSEVRGGGRKPWAQKGTGRARHGSIRSPLWKGGGVTFGPRKEKVYSRNIPLKMKRKALLMVLSEKARGKLIVLLEDIVLKESKTKEASEILRNLHCQNQSVILVTPEIDKKIWLAFRNIPKTKVMPVSDLNALDLLSSKYLITTKEGIKKMKEIFV